MTVRLTAGSVQFRGSRCCDRLIRGGADSLFSKFKFPEPTLAVPIRVPATVREDRGNILCLHDFDRGLHTSPATGPANHTGAEAERHSSVLFLHFQSPR